MSQDWKALLKFVGLRVAIAAVIAYMFFWALDLFTQITAPT